MSIELAGLECLGKNLVLIYNLVNTKVEVRFHVQSANWIPDNVKDAFLKKVKNYHLLWLNNSDLIIRYTLGGRSN